MSVFEFAVNGFPQRMLDLDIRFCTVDFFYRTHQKHNGAPEVSLVGLRGFQRYPLDGSITWKWRLEIYNISVKISHYCIGALSCAAYDIP